MIDEGLVSNIVKLLYLKMGGFVPSPFRGGEGRG